MYIIEKLNTTLSQVLIQLYGIEQTAVSVEPTREDVQGDFTFVVFPYLKASRKGPEQTAIEIGEKVKAAMPEIESIEAIKGFLNFTLTKDYWINFLASAAQLPHYGFSPTRNDDKILIEYSSPNTNKPLHLGHVRNNLLGYAVSQIMKANGYNVITCNLINDRGIHICKSMLAWQLFGNGETPESTGIKGDHFVGKYYVLFENELRAQAKPIYENWIQQGSNMQGEEDTKLSQLLAKLHDASTPEDKRKEINDEVMEMARNHTPIMQQAKEMLRQWEAGNDGIIQVWKQMNQWVYAGFEHTYQTMGVQFDKYYYESDTYLLGKTIVQEGLDKGVFFKKQDGSVWVDLTDEGLDQKLLLRGDGTSVYITQDMGTADLKFADFESNRSVYVVGNEQDYHFKVLQLICKKLNRPYADGIYHLSYGMVELPHGKMKSREGTVVDADDLMQEMIQTAAQTTLELGKTQGLDEQTLNELYQTIGLGALKYFILKVDPKKKMLFNPEESIDFHGNTGPFIQYTHARIRSVLRMATTVDWAHKPQLANITGPEKQLAVLLHKYPQVVKEAGRELSPGVVANYAYEVAKAYNHFYHECPILKEPDADIKQLRLLLCKLTAEVIKSAFGLLGIAVPEKM
jgi:arginyl-tRNA synthetase